VEDLRTLGVESTVGAPPIVLEIGFGRAELIAALAEAEPGRAFLGLEVSRKRVDKAAQRLARRGVTNVRLVHGAAELVLERALPPKCVGECWINCPDPWPKKRHFKRRLIQPPFLSQLARVLVPGAVLHIATDHAGYAEWIAERLACADEFENLHAPARWSLGAPLRPETSYEAEWRAEGRTMVYFEYRRRP
jgi:tRNA (guanine-N7-)-methyltransferase